MAEQRDDILIKDQQHGDQGTEMQDDLHDQRLGLDAQERTGQHKMAGTGNGQKFSKSLNNP